MVFPAVLHPDAFPKGWEPVHFAALPMRFSNKYNFIFCGTGSGCNYLPLQIWTMMDQVSSAGRMLTGTEEQSVQWEGFQAPFEETYSYQLSGQGSVLNCERYLDGS